MAPATGAAFPVSAGIVIPPATSGAFQLPNLNSAGTSGGGQPPLQPHNLQPLPSSPEETSGKPSKKAIMKWESWKVLVLIEIMCEEFIAAKSKEGRECMDRGNYFEMSKEERKSEKLPPKFEKELFDLMGTFLEKHPSINPPCMAESFECQPEAPSEPVPPTEDIPSDNVPPNDSAPPTEAHAPLNQEATSKFNFGVRK
ncbi:hypothetical protein R1flu_021611 [Riccia fluitans]|uniref:Uncharacterized protein n=1 Tax=Riccia fluitans TaxID=41844 RepID=A0ABD1ZPV9_9MARC